MYKIPNQQHNCISIPLSLAVEPQREEKLWFQEILWFRAQTGNNAI
jgi:hypothetical protein